MDTVYTIEHITGGGYDLHHVGTFSSQAKAEAALLGHLSSKDETYYSGLDSKGRVYYQRANTSNLYRICPVKLDVFSE